MNLSKIREIMPQLCKTFKENQSLKEYTRLRIGGEAQFYIKPLNWDSVKKIVKILKEENLPFKILGRGTNLLIYDGKLNFGVIHILNIEKKLEIENQFVRASGDVLFEDIANYTFSHCLSGMEEFSLIPGSVGGAVCMNAGAFGKEFFDILEEIHLINYCGDEISLKPEEVEHFYRKTNIKDKGIVKSVLLKLKEEDEEVIQKKRDEFRKARETKQPYKERTCGSVFKNPEGDFAGRILEKLGFKGKRNGNVSFSSLHSNFLIAEKSATFEEAFSLTEEARMKAKEMGISLEYEMEIWKNEPA